MTFCWPTRQPPINCVLGLGGFLKDRPMFTMGHFFKAMCAESWLSPRDYLQLFQRHQRLQIGLGDSNMAELAEFLRVGTTSLVLDVIEAGAMPPLPTLRQPIRALHQLCRDPSLCQSVRICRRPTDDGAGNPTFLSGMPVVRSCSSSSTFPQKRSR